MDDPDHQHLLTRPEAAADLRRMGLPMAAATLAKYAVLGKGPPMIKFGLRVLYPVGELRAWARRRCCRRCSTSDPGQEIAAEDQFSPPTVDPSTSDE